EVWPENDCFGSASAAPEDEFILLHEIFTTNLGPDDSFLIALKEMVLVPLF
ncbi:hypothetical protein Bhyg_11891, partial [Pseudolycoriella hygida]